MASSSRESSPEMDNEVVLRRVSRMQVNLNSNGASTSRALADGGSSNQGQGTSGQDQSAAQALPPNQEQEAGQGRPMEQEEVGEQEEHIVIVDSPASPPPENEGESPSKVIVLDCQHYNLQNRTYVSFSGKLPPICIICDRFVSKKSASNVSHLEKHQHDNICSSCMAVILSTSKACPLCREERMEIKCSSCKTMYDSATLVTCFHWHKNLHLCIICLPPDCLFC